MRKEVKVVSSEGGKITAGCDKNACEGCKSSLFCRGKNIEFEVLNPKGIEVEPGDDIVIDMPPGKTVFATFMSLGSPLVFFFLGLIAGYFAFPGSEPAQLACAVAGLLVGFAISFVYFRLTKSKYTPTVEDRCD